MPERSFRSYLTAALERIEVDAPGLYRRIGEHLGRRALSIEVDGEVVCLSAPGGRVTLEEGSIRAVVHACTTKAEIVALADGEALLEEAIVAERVHLVGAIDDLLACLDALSAFLNGAVRSPELGSLMGELRREVAARKEVTPEAARGPVGPRA